MLQGALPSCAAHAGALPRPGQSAGLCTEVEGGWPKGPPSSACSGLCDQNMWPHSFPVCTVGMADTSAFLIRPLRCSTSPA